MNYQDKPKLLFIITDLGSFNNFLAELSVYLIDNFNFEIHVICSPKKVININDKYDFQNGPMNFHFVNIPRGYNIINQVKASNQIHKIINEVNPFLIHAHFTTGIFTTLLLKRPNHEIWGTFHGVGYFMNTGVKSLIMKLIENFCFRRLDKIIVINEFDFQKLKKLYQTKVLKLDTLGLGCDIEKFDIERFCGKDRELLKEELNFKDEFVFAYTGRFTHFKGFHLVAKAFLSLSKANPGKFRLIIIGGKDEIHRTGLADSEEKELFDSKFCTPINFTNEVAKYLSVTDVFVFPSKREGMPVCIIEALSMGLPVITWDSRGCNEIVEDNFNGYLINEKDETSAISKIQNKLLFLSENKHFFLKLRENALTRRASYNRENFILSEANRYLAFRNSHD